MIPGDSTALEALEARLLVLEPSALALRTDPRGESWLPADLRRALMRTPEGVALLDEFVATERLMHDGAEAAPDPFFTHRVVSALPQPSLGSAHPMEHRRRRAILAVTHALAAVVGVIVAWPWISGLGDLTMADGLARLAQVDPTHGWIEALRAGGATLMAALGAVALVLVLPFPSGRRVRSQA